MTNELTKTIRRIVLAGIVGITVIWLIYRVGDIAHLIYTTISEGDMLIYYGSILAGLCIFFSLKITIEYQNEQQLINTKKEYRPFISLENSITGSAYAKTYYLEDAKDSEYSFQLYINNIAKYPAINLSFSFSENDNIHSLYLNSDKDNGRSLTMLSNINSQFMVCISINRKQIEEYIHKGTLCGILFEFDDLIKNKYKQKYNIIFKNIIVDRNIASYEIVEINEPELQTRFIYH